MEHPHAPPAHAGWAAAILVRDGDACFATTPRWTVGCQNTCKVLNRWNGPGRRCVLWFVRTMQIYPSKHPRCTLRFHSHCKIWLQESRFVKLSLERKGPDPVTEHLTVHHQVVGHQRGRTEKSSQCLDSDP